MALSPLMSRLSRVKNHIFSGSRFRVRFVTRGASGPCDPHHNHVGLADSPETKGSQREVFIDTDQSPRELMDTCIHEGLHCCCPYLTEEVVTDTATSLARFLERVGFQIAPYLAPDLKGINSQEG